MHTFLVVIYNRRFSEVSTLNTLLQMTGVRDLPTSLYIWDNSPVQFEQQELEALDAFRDKFANVHYYRSRDNASLSALYNRVANEVFSGNSCALTLLDHDSEVAADFFTKIEAAMSGSKLVVPKVVSNRSNRIISPRFQASHAFSIRPREPLVVASDAFGDTAASDFFAVGSGMTISRELWRAGLRFEEALSFYGVDTEYCRDYALTHSSFVIADTFLLHDISSEGNETAASIKWRFDSHMDYWVLQLRKHSNMPKLVVVPYVALWRALFAVKHRVRNFLSK